MKGLECNTVFGETVLRKISGEWIRYKLIMVSNGYCGTVRAYLYECVCVCVFRYLVKECAGKIWYRIFCRSYNVRCEIIFHRHLVGAGIFSAQVRMFQFLCG
jgi:hypothetical protein